MYKDFELKNEIIVSVWEQWSEVFHMSKFNWSTFNVFNLELENDRMLGGFEIKLVLFLVGIRVRIPTPNKKSEKEWKKINKSIKSLNDSCYGYVGANNYKHYKKQESPFLIVTTHKRKGIINKKVFIQ